MTVPRLRPPAPEPLSPTGALARYLLSGRGDLLSLLPRDAYETGIGPLGRTRRGILLVNDPALVTEVMVDRAEEFPKNDLFVGALAPLVNDGVFVSHGETWRAQRRMIDPAFGHMHLARAFPKMQAAVDALEAGLTAEVAAGRPVELDRAMSRVTADVITRAIFSEDLDSEAAQAVFTSFAAFQTSVAHLRPFHLLLGRPWAAIRQPPEAVAAAARIRELMRAWLAPRFDAPAPADIAGAVLAARDPKGGGRLGLEQVIDQIGVFFLAGHETTATGLAWTLFLLSQDRAARAQARAEVDAVAPEGPVTLDEVKRMPFLRACFEEALRLYPPLAFLPRVAARDGELGGRALRRGTMVMISPWIAQRRAAVWEAPDRFDPTRFLPEARRSIPQGAFLPFGLGPRVCIGAGFATVEAVLILARLLRDWEIEVREPGRVRPVVRLTTRTAEPMRADVRRRARAPRPAAAPAAG